MEYIYLSIYHPFPKLLPNIQTLAFDDLPLLHPSFFMHCSRFTKVVILQLCSSKSLSFCEITQLINRLPYLKELKILNCQWSQPIHYYSGRQSRFKSLIFSHSNPVYGVDLLKWLIASHSVATLVSLDWREVDSTHITMLNDILQVSAPTLQNVDFDFSNGNIGMLMIFQNDTYFSTLFLIVLPSFKYNIALQSLCFSNISADWFFFYLFHNFETTSSTLNKLELRFSDFDKDIYSNSHRANWKIADDLLSNSNITSLNLSKTHSYKKKVYTVLVIFKEILPKSYQRGILWCCVNNKCEYMYSIIKLSIF